MPFVSVPKDLTKVKTKVALNLTKRQLICFSIAGAIGIPTYLLTKDAIGNDIAVLLMIGLMLPFFFFAMYEKDGLPAEKIARNWLRVKLWSGTRIYQTDNLYKYLNEVGNKAPSESRGAHGGTGPAREAHRECNEPCHRRNGGVSLEEGLRIADENETTGKAGAKAPAKRKTGKSR